MRNSENPWTKKHLDPRRRVECICGWATERNTLRSANEAWGSHVESLEVVASKAADDLAPAYPGGREQAYTDGMQHLLKQHRVTYIDL